MKNTAIVTDSTSDLPVRLAREIKPKEIIRTDIGIVVGSHPGIGGLGITCYIQ